MTGLHFCTRASTSLRRIRQKMVWPAADMWWDSPAFKAGITPDMHLIAVNGETYSVPVLRAAIVEAEKGNAPIKLLLKRGDQFQNVDLDYHGGLRYPALERVQGSDDRLDAILAPSK
jgi:predicted metalloprotease with PDZ domain